MTTPAPQTDRDSHRSERFRAIWPVRSVRGRAAALIVLTLMTASVIAAILLADSARRYRETNERQLAGAARTLALALDGEIGKADTLLRTLAASQALKDADFAGVDAQARAVLHDPAMWFFVQDENGNSLVNTFRPVGSPPGHGNPANYKPRWAQLLKAGHTVSPLVRGAQSGELVVGLNVLAHDAKGRPYNLGVVIRPEVINRLLTRQDLPSGWYSGVLDQNGVIIGRNVRPLQFLGQSAPPDMLKAIHRQQAGVRETVSRDGVKVLSAFDHSELTGWTVAVAMPRSEATGYLSRSLRLLALGSLALLLVGGVLSFLLARGTSRAVERVVAAAQKLGAGEDLGSAGQRTGLLETDQIIDAVRAASTRLRAREAELKALNETLEARIEETASKLVQAQKIDTLGQLTGGVAHDFNNLLSPIIGGLDRLQRGGLSEEKAQRSIAGALEAAERAKTLVQRLLAFARRQPLQPSAVDVAQALTGLRSLLESTLGPRVAIVFDLPPNLPLAKADANQLDLAILNLAVNARDAMLLGGTFTISAAGETVIEPDGELLPGRYVRLSLSDTGEGMEPSVLRRAVEPFFSTKGVGRGTGLGLSMVHGLAAQLGGALQLNSEPGKGATVHLWLPVIESTATPPLPVDSIPLGISAGAVLLVEDDALVRASTSAMLADLGYAVIEAISGQEALKVLEGGVAIDLLVTDHLMPGITGAELAAAVQHRWPQIRTLIISGYADVDEIAPDLPRLVKPFRQNDLAAALRNLSIPRPSPA